MIGESSVVQKVCVVSIGRIVLAASGNGFLLTSGFASQDGAKPARKKCIYVFRLKSLAHSLTHSLNCAIAIKHVCVNSPSHAVAKETVDLAVVGKEGANMLLRRR